MNCFVFWNGLIAFTFGAIFGIAEILQRHTRSNDSYAFHAWASWAYVALNGIVSVVAFFSLRYFRDALATLTEIDWKNILIAGFGGMMVLRSSIFSYQFRNGEKIGIGLDAVIQIFLKWAEDKIENTAGATRFIKMDKIMKDIDFDRAKDVLPLTCVANIDDFKEDEVGKMLDEISELSEKKIPMRSKSEQLGRLVAKNCGKSLLKKVVHKFKDEISVSGNKKDESRLVTTEDSIPSYRKIDL